MSVTDTKKIVKIQEPIDLSVQLLSQEAEALFNVLDNTSRKFRDLEDRLSELKAHFPFRFLVKEENESRQKFVENYHRDACPYATFYKTKDCSYFAWEQDEHSKKFRLFLIVEELESIYYLIAEDVYESFVYQNRVLSKRPLIETDLATRLRYSEYLIPFIDAFKEYMKTSRIAIEEGRNPF